jgi:cephalosporin hydroxylase
VHLIKQYERNSKQLNFILNQINVIIYSHQHSMKKYLPRVKFYQPKATGGGFLIFEWTLTTCVEKKNVVKWPGAGFCFR